MNEQQLTDAAIVAYEAARTWNQQIGIYDDPFWCEVENSERAAWLNACREFVDSGIPLVPANELAMVTPLQALRVPLVAGVLTTFKEFYT